MEENIIIQTIFTAIDEINDLFEKSISLKKDSGSILIGDASSLSSLQFVTLIAEIEDHIENGFGIKLSLLEILSDDLERNKELTVSALAKRVAIAWRKQK